MTEYKDKQCGYYQGKFFDTLQEMLEYANKWPDLPFDLQAYKVFLNMRLEEAITNSSINKTLTNRAVYRILRMNTDWCDQGEK